MLIKGYPSVRLGRGNGIAPVGGFPTSRLGTRCGKLQLAEARSREAGASKAAFPSGAWERAEIAGRLVGNPPPRAAEGFRQA